MDVNQSKENSPAGAGKFFNFILYFNFTATIIFIFLWIIVPDAMKRITLAALNESMTETQLNKKIDSLSVAPAKKDSLKRDKIALIDSGAIANLLEELKDERIGFTPKKEYIEIQNQIADLLHLPIITEDNIDSLKESKFLIPLTRRIELRDVSFKFTIKPVNEILKKFNAGFLKKFRTRLTSTSATRTLEFQEKLFKANKNASEHGSLHIRGCAVDISYKDLTRDQVNWLELMFKKEEEKDHRIWVTKEGIGNLHYHIVIFPLPAQLSIQSN